VIVVHGIADQARGETVVAVAAEEMSLSPNALELRRMQMLTEVGAEQNTMTVVMMPSEFVNAAGAYVTAQAIAQAKAKAQLG
jgi:hypothetical protein